MKPATGFRWLSIAVAFMAAVPTAAWAAYDEWAPAKDIDTTTQDVFDVHVAVSPGGATVAVWQQLDPTAGQYGVAARVQSPGGAGLRYIHQRPRGWLRERA
jgi:hypothetical protein